MLPTVRNVFPEDQMPNIGFVQDNCPIHRSRSVQEWFDRQENISIIRWPARSPDLNPIENLWVDFKERFHARCIQIGLKLSIRPEVLERYATVLRQVWRE